MKVQSDDKIVQMHTKSFSNLVANMSEAETEITFENYSNINPIFDIKTINADHKADTSDYSSCMKEDAVVLNAIAAGFKQVDVDMANGMGKKK